MADETPHLHHAGGTEVYGHVHGAGGMHHEHDGEAWLGIVPVEEQERNLTAVRAYEAGLAVGAVIVDLAKDAARLRGHLRTLVEQNGVGWDVIWGGNFCAYCEGVKGFPGPFTHDEMCPWVKAKEILGG